MKRSSRTNHFSTAAAGLSVAMGAAAPVGAQEAAIVLDQIVVTAAGFEQNVADAPASVTVIPGEALAEQVRDLTNALEGVQGVAVTGPANERDIFIRGLPGAYTLILVDGKRQGTRDARPNGSAGLEQSFVPPTAAIDRIEVVRGPMSSLYGSDAMGGVINIITRPVADAWTGSVSAGGTVNEDRDFGDALDGSIYLSGPIVPDRLGLRIWARGLLRGEDEMLSGITGAREGDVSARLSFSSNARHDFALQGGVSRIRREASAGETLEEDASDLSTDHDRRFWSLTHDGNWSGFSTNLSIQQEWGERTTRERDEETGDLAENPRSPEIRNTVVDASATVPFALGGAHIAVLGGQFFQARLRDQNPGRRTGEDETFSIDQWAVFGEAEWGVTDRVALTTGARLDHHDEYGYQVTPRVYGVWRATDSLTVKGGISTGFRAPDVRQIAPGYAYTTGGSGAATGRTGPAG